MKTIAERDLIVSLEVKFENWHPTLDNECAHTFRIYNDGVWEFLNRDGNPICQGVDAKFTVSDAK